MGVNILEQRRRIMMMQPHEETQSGAVVTFNTFVPQKLAPVVAVNPVQDLHGYSYPWVGGANKNKFDQKTFGWSTSTTIVYVPLNIGEGTFTISTDFPNNSTKDVFVFAGQVDTGASSSTNGVSSTVPRTVTAVDGYITLASRKNNSRPNPANYNWQIEAGETATSFVPYSNICPIYGFDAANITGTNKNILSGIEQGAWDENGEKVIQNARVRSIGRVRVESGEKYTVSGVNTDTSAGTLQAFTRFYPDPYSVEVSELTWSSLPYTFTVPNNAKYATIHFRLSTTVAITPSIIEDAQIEKGETASTYVPFGTVYNITFPDAAGTVYGGTLTINKDGTSRLDVDQFLEDAKNMTWTLNTTADNRCVYRCRKSANTLVNGYALSNRLKYVSGEPWTIAVTNNRDIYIAVDPTINNTTLLQNYLEDNLTQIVYKTKTATTYNLTALQVIGTLQGINNIYADTGNLSVEYWTN